MRTRAKATLNDKKLEIPVEEAQKPSKATKRKRISSPNPEEDNSAVEAYYSYKGHPNKWAQLSSAQRRSVFENAFKTRKSINCLEKTCKRRLRNVDNALGHVDRCILPEYYTYSGKISEFRSLEKKDKQRVIKEGLLAVRPLLCLNEPTCTFKSAHPFGALYHIERCGLDDKDCPWSCYRCGYVGTLDQSRGHLDECRATSNKEDEAEEPEQELESEEEVCQVDSKRRRKFGVKVLSNDVVFFKNKIPFKKYHRSDDSSHIRSLYFSHATEALKRFEKDTTGDRFPDIIRNIERCIWKQISLSDCSTSYQRLPRKQSVPICLPSTSTKEINQLNNGESSSTSQRSKERLSPYEPKRFHFSSYDNNLANASLVYCGGPVSCIRCCPKRCNSGYECVAVSIFYDEEYLEDAADASSRDYVQFWLFNGPQKNEIRLWFVLEVELGMILSMEWCPSIRDSEHWTSCSPNKNLLGLLAIGGSLGFIHIYSIFEDISINESNSSEDVRIFKGVPYIVLKNASDYETGPIISITWSTFNGSSNIAAVSQVHHGYVYIWDLNTPENQPDVFIESKTLSPYAVSFCDRNILVISFLNTSIHMYDLRSGNCIFEDALLKAAGSKVCGCESLFSGVFTYQSTLLPVAGKNGSQFYTVSPSYFISLDGSRKNGVSLPIANRHEIELAELSVCPITGAVFSVGLDGKLKVSLNGKVPPHGADDHFFAYCRIVMSLIRRNNETSIPSENMETNGDNPPLRIPNSNLELCAQNTYLEMSFDDDVENRFLPVDAVSMDLRTESLNRVHASQESSCEIHHHQLPELNNK